jgi:hypothetical protein
MQIEASVAMSEVASAYCTYVPTILYCTQAAAFGVGPRDAAAQGRMKLLTSLLLH